MAIFLFKRSKTNHSVKPGTKISLNHKIKAIPDGYSVKLNNGYANRIVNNFDPFTHESFDIELGKSFR